LATSRKLTTSVLEPGFSPVYTGTFTGTIPQQQASNAPVGWLEGLAEVVPFAWSTRPDRRAKKSIRWLSVAQSAGWNLHVRGINVQVSNKDRSAL